MENIYKISTFNGTVKEETVFYIRSKGSNAGQPVKTPTANCFQVSVNDSVLNSTYFYYFILNAFNKECFSPFVKGSVIPFITIQDFKKALEKEILK